MPASRHGCQGRCARFARAEGQVVQAASLAASLAEIERSGNRPSPKTLPKLAQEPRFHGTSKSSNGAAFALGIRRAPPDRRVAFSSAAPVEPLVSAIRALAGAPRLTVTQDARRELPRSGFVQSPICQLRASLPEPFPLRRDGIRLDL